MPLGAAQAPEAHLERCQAVRLLPLTWSTPVTSHPPCVFLFPALCRGIARVAATVACGAVTLAARFLHWAGNAADQAVMATPLGGRSPRSQLSAAVGAGKGKLCRKENNRR